MSDTPSMKELPPPPTAEFSRIVEMFASQAFAAFGKLPQTQSEPRLDYAKYFIDLLEVLQEKSKGNISKEEADALEGTLHYLRMMYVDAKKA